VGPSDAEFKTLVARELQALRVRLEALEAEIANLKAAPAPRPKQNDGNAKGASDAGRCA
jgi:hypothetical protein